MDGRTGTAFIKSAIIWVHYSKKSWSLLLLCSRKQNEADTDSLEENRHKFYKTMIVWVKWHVQRDTHNSRSCWVGHHSWEMGQIHKSIKPQSLTFIIAPSQSLLKGGNSWVISADSEELKSMFSHRFVSAGAAGLGCSPIPGYKRAHCVPALLLLFPPALPYLSPTFCCHFSCPFNSNSHNHLHQIYFHTFSI